MASLLFFIAIIHTFLIKKFQHFAQQFPRKSVPASLFHLLGEVEIIFGFWAGVFIGALSLATTPEQAVTYLNELDFSEAAFVFVIMTISSTKPITDLVKTLIFSAANLISKTKPALAFYGVALTFGPLIGSLITEPAAMTITAIVLKESFFNQQRSSKFRYLTLAVLFVNVSIGGTLTPFAAPPVLMVAHSWKWDLAYMFGHFGWKAMVAVLLNTLFAITLIKKELVTEFNNKTKFNKKPNLKHSAPTPLWLIGIHLFFLFLILWTAHSTQVFLAIFLFFLGITSVTQSYQTEIRLRESLLVSFFLGGLIVLGGPQKWWLQPLLQSLSESSLFLCTTVLTAFTDNAALTYLGSQSQLISDAHKYALVSGAVSGGGLSILANAPNPAGLAVLNDSFGPEGVSPSHLFRAAIVPTLVAMACFWFLP